MTPSVNKIHHSRQLTETNSNYGNILTLYDRLLGTYTPAERAHSVIYGLDDVDPVGTGSFPGLLSVPFATATSVRRATRSKSAVPSARVASQQ